MVATAGGETETRVEAGVGRVARAESGWVALLLATFALYYLAPGLPLSLLLLAACAALCFLCLPLAVSLVPLAMPFFMLPKHLGHLEFSLGETAIVLCAVSFALHTAWDVMRGTDTLAGLAEMARRALPPTRLTSAIAVFLLAATLATLSAHVRHVALRQYRWVVLEPIAYYVLVVALLRDTRAMARALWAVAGSGALVAALGLYQYLFRPGDLTGATYGGTPWQPVRQLLHQVAAVYGSPNNLGLLLDRTIPVAVVLALAALAAPRTRRPTRAAGAWTGVAAVAAVLLMAVVLVLSGSRGGMITAVAAAVLGALLWLWPGYGRGRGRGPGALVPWRDRERPLALGGVIVVLAAATLVLWRVRHGLSTGARILVWQSGLRMIRDHPLLGIGPDNFLYYYFDPANRGPYRCVPPGTALPARHYMSPRAWQEPCLSHPHNVVLDAWLSTGLLGLVALAAIVVLAALQARRNLHLLPAGPPRAIQVAAVVVVAATLAHGLVDNSIFVPDLAVAFWLAVAVTANLAVPAPRAAVTAATVATPPYTDAAHGNRGGVAPPRT